MKTQMRRVVVPSRGRQSEWLTRELLDAVRRVEVGRWDCGFGVALTHPGGGPLGFISCPYGGPGDFLWVRETHWTPPCPRHGEGQPPGSACRCREVFYRADAERPFPWRPSIHMPRWASRILLRVTAVRVERLQAISKKDAVAEGVERVGSDWRDYGEESPPFVNSDPRFSFRSLWGSLNGPGSWTANPWVWVITFARVDGVPEGAKARPILLSAPMVRAILEGAA